MIRGVYDVTALNSLSSRESLEDGLNSHAPSHTLVLKKHFESVQLSSPGSGSKDQFILSRVLADDVTLAQFKRAITAERARTKYTRNLERRVRSYTQNNQHYCL